MCKDQESRLELIVGVSLLLVVLVLIGFICIMRTYVKRQLSLLKDAKRGVSEFRIPKEADFDSIEYVSKSVN